MNIIHRDISINNIMIYCTKGDDPKPSITPHVALGKGLLIDFDYATYLDLKNTHMSPGD